MGHRLLALGVGGVVLTATVLVGVGAWQTSTFASAASDSVAAIGRADAGQHRHRRRPPDRLGRVTPGRARSTAP
jgi:hypothetical protein